MTDKKRVSARNATIAGAAIGSAAIAAALLYTSRRKPKSDFSKATPGPGAKLPPETD